MSININLWLACTNLLAIPAICYAKCTFQQFLALAVMIASSFMHLSETKHGLHGISPFFDQYSNLFLNIDRMVSIVGVFYMVNNLYNNIQFWIYGIIGVAAMAIGEKRGVSVIVYVYLHTIWHIIIYFILLYF
jgi:hypothetical protein